MPRRRRVHDRGSFALPYALRGRSAGGGRQRGEVLALVGREVVDGSRAGPGRVLPARRTGTLRVQAPLRAGRDRSSQASGNRERSPDGAAVLRRCRSRTRCLHRPGDRQDGGADHARHGSSGRTSGHRTLLGPVFPTDGGEVDSTDLVFRWLPARGSRRRIGSPITTSRHIQIGRPEVAGLRTYKLRLGPPDGKTSTRSPRAGSWHLNGLLPRRPGKGMRKGLGPLSSTWSFTPRGPAPACRRDARVRPGPDVKDHTVEASAGRKPAKYRIYGSDEEAHRERTVPGRRWSIEGFSKRQANFVAEVSMTEAVVIRLGCRLANQSELPTRVVAVDGREAEQATQTSPRHPGRSSIRARSPTRKWDRSTITRCPPFVRSEMSGPAWSTARRR